MWVKLISPKMSMRPMDSAFKIQMAPPLSLLTLGALTPEKHKVTISDENIEVLNFEDSPDLIGITVKADTANRSWEIARIYREKGIPVVFGGIYPTTCPEENFNHADSLVIGEAEMLWEQLLQDAENGCLRKLYKNDTAPDLSKSPTPKWELISEKNYLYTNTLTIGRGCPWNCSFCYNSSPNLFPGYRMKPIENILQEIKSVNSRHIMFIDDNFLANPPFARELLKKFLPLGLTWHTAVSADIGSHDDILDQMAESGCRSLFIGFETLNPKNLASTNKQQNHIEKYEEVVSKIHSRGIMVNASVVFGFDGDGPEVFKQTTDWLINQKIETMTAHIMTPYPGTKLFSQLQNENRILDQDLSHYNTSYAVFEPKGMSRTELEAGYRRTYQDFYSWQSIWRRFPFDVKRYKPYLLFNMGYRKYGHVFSKLGTRGLMRTLGNLSARISFPELRISKSQTV